MSPEDQCDAIIGYCGWDFDNGEWFVCKDGDIIGFPWPSLDAMHFAERSLTDTEIPKYMELLLYKSYPWNAVSSDVDQRQVAFLKVKGLWKEES